MKLDIYILDRTPALNYLNDLGIEYDIEDSPNSHYISVEITGRRDLFQFELRGGADAFYGNLLQGNNQ